MVVSNFMMTINYTLKVNKQRVPQQTVFRNKAPNLLWKKSLLNYILLSGMLQRKDYDIKRKQKQRDVRQFSFVQEWEV